MAVAGIVLALYVVEICHGFAPGDRWLGDRLMNLAPIGRLRQPPLVVTVDDATVASAGRWPMPRRVYAELLSAIAAGKPRAVGVDLLFAESGHYDPAGDSLLVRAAAGHPEFVFAVSFEPAEARGAAPLTPTPGELRTLALNGVLAPGTTLWPARPTSVPAADLLAEVRVGHVAVAIDPDGVARRVPMFLAWGDRLYPALSLAVAGQALGRGDPVAVTELRRSFQVRWSDGTREEIPFDGNGTTPLRYRRISGENLSAAALLTTARAGDLASLRSYLADRVVILGNSATQTGVADVGALWNAPVTPLMFLHRDAIDALLADRILRPVPPGVSVLLVGLVAIGIGLVGAFQPLRRVVLLAGLAEVGVMLGLVALSMTTHRMSSSTLSLLVVPVAAAAAVAVRLVGEEAERHRRETERKQAAAIMAGVLPRHPPAWPGLEVAWIFEPHQEIGGDFIFLHEDAAGRRIVGLVDVAGKGLPAALVASHLLGCLRPALTGGASLVGLAHDLDHALRAGEIPGRFATLFLAAFPPNEPQLRYVNCGHDPGLLLSGRTTIQLLSSGDPIGLYPDAAFREETVPFHPGDVLLLVTDGVTDAGATTGTPYGVERLEEVARRRHVAGASPQFTLGAVGDDMAAFLSGRVPSDDICMVMIISLSRAAATTAS